MTTVTFQGTKQELEHAKKTILEGVKVRAKLQSCFYCNCQENKYCGCTCHKITKPLPRIGWGVEKK
ncbi:hypothetical protein LCGC14_0978800 [marine sediment metagenome]|uniref:Uncharacterized protein n=1 Tax=marine sediment metagenome TaxID=412755 RepID=A0A0F9RFW6_9ZZZZ